MGNADWPVLGCCTPHGERACPRCFDVPVAQADVEAVVVLLRRAEHAGVVPFGEARDTERHFRLCRPRVFTLRCVVGDVAEVSARAGELVEPAGASGRGRIMTTLAPAPTYDFRGHPLLKTALRLGTGPVPSGAPWAGLGADPVPSDALARVHALAAPPRNRADVLALFGPRPSFAPLTQGET